MNDLSGTINLKFHGNKINIDDMNDFLDLPFLYRKKNIKNDSLLLRAEEDSVLYKKNIEKYSEILDFLSTIASSTVKFNILKERYQCVLFIVLNSKNQSSIIRFHLEKNIIKKLVEMGLEISICFSIENGLLKKDIEKCAELTDAETDFIYHLYSKEVSSTSLRLYKNNEPEFYSCDFRYLNKPEKNKYWKSYINNLESYLKCIKHKSASKKISSQIYCFSWYEWYPISKHELKKLNKMNISLEFNWFGGGWLPNN